MFLEHTEEYSDRPSRFRFRIDPFTTAATGAIATDGETSGLTPEQEGRKIVAQSIRYERSAKNRAAALRHHGTKCKACGFDFDEVYGEQHARHFIQVHHTDSITEGVRVVDPQTDLIPLCSNCHSMAHRGQGKILSVAEIVDYCAQRDSDNAFTADWYEAGESHSRQATSAKRQLAPIINPIRKADRGLHS